MVGNVISCDGSSHLVNVALGRVSRFWASGLLLAGIGYAVANIGVIAVTLSMDKFAIFERYACSLRKRLIGAALNLGEASKLAGFTHFLLSHSSHSRRVYGILIYEMSL